MGKLIRKSSLAVAAIAVVFAAGLCTAQEIEAQTARDVVGAAGAMTLAQNMGIPNRVIRNWPSDGMTVDGGWTDAEISYPYDGVYQCRMVAAVAMATAASRVTDLSADVDCPSHSIDVSLELDYAGNLESFSVVQYNDGGRVVWKKSGRR